MTLRKAIKNKRVFPSNEAVFKLLYSALNAFRVNGHTDSQLEDSHESTYDKIHCSFR